MTKLTYKWEKIVDIIYVKVYVNENNYVGVLSFNDDDSFSLFMDSAMCGIQGLANDAPILSEYKNPDNPDEYKTGQIEVIYEDKA